MGAIVTSGQSRFAYLGFGGHTTVNLYNYSRISVARDAVGVLKNPYQSKYHSHNFSALFGECFAREPVLTLGFHLKHSSL